MLCRLAGIVTLGFVLISAPRAWGQDVASMVKMHVEWEDETSSPTASLAIQESSRSGRTIKYRLVAKGLPSNTTYTVVAWPVTSAQPLAVQRGVTLNESGLAICAGTSNTCKGDKPNDPVELAFQPAQGEPLRLGLASADDENRAFAKIVPIPLQVEDQGCTVEAVLLTAGSELVWITGSGFPPNSEVVFDSNSEGELVNRKVKTDTNGRYATAVLPYKKGVSKGTVKVAIKAPECSPSVSVPWGKR